MTHVPSISFRENLLRSHCHYCTHFYPTNDKPLLQASHPAPATAQRHGEGVTGARPGPSQGPFGATGAGLIGERLSFQITRGITLLFLTRVATAASKNSGVGATGPRHAPVSV